METVQVFTKNQQQWKARPLDESVIKEFRTHAERLGYEQIVAHDSYLINLASPGAELWEKSIEAFAEEMRRCDQLTIPYLVTHPGAHVGTGEEAGIARVVAAVVRMLQKDEKGGVTVCLETTAGQGSTLGYRFEQLAAMLAGIDAAGFGHRVGVCVDTCHILAGGYDITTAASARAVLEEMDRVIGLHRVKAWHLNDSQKPLGSRVDRHEHIGRGCVGLEAFGVICSDPRMANVPKIMETPKDCCPDGRDWDVVNLALLRTMAGGEKAVLDVFKEKASKAGKIAATPKQKPARTASRVQANQNRGPRITSGSARPAKWAPGAWRWGPPASAAGSRGAWPEPRRASRRRCLPAPWWDECRYPRGGSFHSPCCRRH
jgi:deoxyribonuclease-4